MPLWEVQPCSSHYPPSAIAPLRDSGEVQLPAVQRHGLALRRSHADPEGNVTLQRGRRGELRRLFPPVLVGNFEEAQCSQFGLPLRTPSAYLGEDRPGGRGGFHAAPREPGSRGYKKVTSSCDCTQRQWASYSRWSLPLSLQGSQSTWPFLQAVRAGLLLLSLSPLASLLGSKAGACLPKKPLATWGG